MKKIIPILIIFFLLFSLCLPVHTVKANSSGNTIYVDAEGFGDYKKIQDAIDHAEDGDTVYVRSGIYCENVVINKKIILDGESKGNSIIDGGGHGDVVSVTADGVTIKGVTLKNGGSMGWPNYDAGVDVCASNVEITNCQIYHSWSGIFIHTWGPNNHISKSIISNNDRGVFIWEYCYNNTLAKSIISNNEIGCVIFPNSNNNNVLECLITENKEGIYVFENTNENKIYHNNFVNNENQSYDKGSNCWDNGSKGNYWDDYDGKDGNGDGIGDIPYIIPRGNNKDDYPLMNPLTLNLPEEEKPTERFTFLFMMMIVVLILISLTIAWFMYRKLKKGKLLQEHIPRKKILVKIIKIYLLLLVVWTIFRYFTADFVKASDTNFFILQIIFESLIWLIPVLVYVIFLERRSLSSLGLVRKNLFSSILIGLILCVVGYILYCLLLPSLLSLFGYVDISTLQVWIAPQSSDINWLLLMSFTVFVIIAVSEEIVHRGFIQNRLMEKTSPLIAILFSSFLFTISHLPILIFIYQYNMHTFIVFLFDIFTFSLILGYFFYKTKNLFGCIVWHGLHDWQSFFYAFTSKGKYIPEDLLFLSHLISSVVVLMLSVIVIYVVFRWIEHRKEIKQKFLSKTELISVKCPYCNTTFNVTPTKKPFKAKCPSCGKESMMR